MAKGSVRKKGKKWYYRFYVEDASGNLVQKEYAGTESKSETEKLLRQAMEDYEAKRFVARTENITLGEMFDIWAHDELMTGSLSNGTVDKYLNVIARMKKHPLANRKLKTVTSEHLQQFIDMLVFGGCAGQFEIKPSAHSNINSYMAVLKHTFRYAVFPKQYITFNPMEYVVPKKKQNNIELFLDEDEMDGDIQPVTPEMYARLIKYLSENNKPALLPVQIAYLAGLRRGEACGLSWQDINLEEQCLTVRRSVRYNKSAHRMEVGPPKRNKVRIVDFGDTLADILRKAKRQQRKSRLAYGELWQKNYYREIREKNRVYYQLYHLDGTVEIPEDYTEIDLVCLREDGAYESPSTLEYGCRAVKKQLPGFENFHFHVLRHSYTSNLLANGANPKDVQELLGHSDVRITMNVYAHATKEAKRSTARLLDKVVGME